MRITLAAFAVIFVLCANFAEARVIVYRSRPAIVVHSAPAAVYVAPAPAAVVIREGPTGAQRRHARKAAEHARKADYWASRS